MGQKKYADLVPEMRRLRALGWTYERIAEQLGIYHSAVGRYLNPETRARGNECNARWRAKNPGYINKSMIRWQAGRRAGILALYGGKCSGCGEERPKTLQLNHIHGGGTKEYREVGPSVHLYDAILKGERNKEDYNLLCVNCNILYEYERGKRVRPGPLHLAAVLKIGNKCAECGNSDKRVLQINHLNGGGSNEMKARRGNVNFYHAIMNGTRGTDDLNVLCANCNILFKSPKISSWITEDESDEEEVVEEFSNSQALFNQLRKNIQGGNQQ